MIGVIGTTEGGGGLTHRRPGACSPLRPAQGRHGSQRQDGFSLLEMVVTMAILGLALGALYQAASGATRNVRADQRYAYAVELARSLVADNSIVPTSGLNSEGVTSGGFRWTATAIPIPRPGESPLGDGRLQNLRVSVSWPDGRRIREVVLHSVVAGQNPALP